MSLFWMRRPHVPLLCLLIAVVVVFPFIERSAVARCSANFAVLGGIVLSLRRVRATPAGVRAAVAFAGVAVTGQILSEAHVSAEAALVSAIAQTAFFGVAAALMCAYMLRDQRATIDELYAAASAFMLIVLAWAAGYWVIEHLRPGSFAISYPTIADHRTWFELFYLSMTTLTTTGFGDVVPVSTGARAAVMLEQFTGVLYVALVISRLAGFAGRSKGG
jgi:hypothetical protein